MGTVTSLEGSGKDQDRNVGEGGQGKGWLWIPGTAVKDVGVPHCGVNPGLFCLISLPPPMQVMAPGEEEAPT